MPSVTVSYVSMAHCRIKGWTRATRDFTYTNQSSRPVDLPRSLAEWVRAEDAFTALASTRNCGVAPFKDWRTAVHLLCEQRPHPPQNYESQGREPKERGCTCQHHKPVNLLIARFSRHRREPPGHSVTNDDRSVADRFLEGWHYSSRGDFPHSHRARSPMLAIVARLTIHIRAAASVSKSRMTVLLPSGVVSITRKPSAVDSMR